MGVEHVVDFDADDVSLKRANAAIAGVPLARSD